MAQVMLMPQAEQTISSPFRFEKLPCPNANKAGLGKNSSLSTGQQDDITSVDLSTYKYPDRPPAAMLGGRSRSQTINVPVGQRFLRKIPAPPRSGTRRHHIPPIMPLHVVASPYYSPSVQYQHQLSASGPVYTPITPAMESSSTIFFHPHSAALSSASSSLPSLATPSTASTCGPTHPTFARRRNSAIRRQSMLENTAVAKSSLAPSSSDISAARRGSCSAIVHLTPTSVRGPPSQPIPSPHSSHTLYAVQEGTNDIIASPSMSCKSHSKRTSSAADFSDDGEPSTKAQRRGLYHHIQSIASASDPGRHSSAGSAGSVPVKLEDAGSFDDPSRAGIEAEAALAIFENGVDEIKMDRTDTPEEARGTIVGHKPVASASLDRSSSLENSAASSLSANGLPLPMEADSLSSLLTSKKVSADMQQGLVVPTEQQKRKGEWRRATLPKLTHRPASKSVSSLPSRSTNSKPSLTSGLANRRAHTAQDKARNLAIVTPPFFQSNCGQTAPLHSSLQQVYTSPADSRTIPNDVRTINSAPTARHVTSSASLSSGANRRAEPFLPLNLVEPHPCMPSFTRYTYRPAHHIPPLPIQFRQIANETYPAQASPRSSKAKFMSAFESLYDALPDACAIQMHVEEMLGNAAGNLEREVESERTRRTEWEKRMDETLDNFRANVSSELILLERRIESLERDAGLTGSKDYHQGNKDKEDEAIQVMCHRIQNLEKIKTPTLFLGGLPKDHDMDIDTQEEARSPRTTRPTSHLRGK